jgi:hypothetical protein
VILSLITGGDAIVVYATPDEIARQREELEKQWSGINERIALLNSADGRETLAKRYDPELAKWAQQVEAEHGKLLAGAMPMLAALQGITEYVQKYNELNRIEKRSDAYRFAVDAPPPRRLS